MIDIHKQVAYWRQGAEEDLAVARHLVENGRLRHGLFFAHLALEKLLKSLICRNTGDLAPRIHNLSRLAELAKLNLGTGQLEVLAEMNAFQVEGRYPESLMPPPTREESVLYLMRAEEVFRCLMSRL